MANNIAFNEKNEITHSADIYRLRNKDKRKDAREEHYTCPHCHSKMTYSHSGEEGCFKHLPSTPQDVKDECPYYSGLLTGCSKEDALAIEKKKREVQSYLESNGIEGYKVISYYSEPNLVKYIEKHPDEDFIMVGNKITNWEYEKLVRNVLTLRKKALAKYLSSNKKDCIQAFVGTAPDKIYLMKVAYEYKSEVDLHPHILSLNDLQHKSFSASGRLMDQSDIIETRNTVGRHDNRSLSNYFRT